jgi:hypothetical protein
MDRFFGFSHPKHGTIMVCCTGSEDALRWCGGALFECFDREMHGGPPVRMMPKEQGPTEPSPPQPSPLPGVA